MHQLQSNKLPKLFLDLLAKLTLCMVTIPDMHRKIYVFDQEWKKVLLKIYWPLKGLNFEQTLTTFIKTRNLVPFPPKNTTKIF